MTCFCWITCNVVTVFSFFSGSSAVSGLPEVKALSLLFNPVYLFLTIVHSLTTSFAITSFSLAVLSYVRTLIGPAPVGSSKGTVMSLFSWRLSSSPVSWFLFLAVWLCQYFSYASTHRIKVALFRIFISFSSFSLCFFLIADSNTTNPLVSLTLIFAG